MATVTAPAPRRSHAAAAGDAALRPAPRATKATPAKKAATKAAGAIDDPVRLYRWRREFRHTLLANDFVLAGAVRMLEKVRDGGLRLDRTIEVSVTNTAEKKRLLKRLGPNLETLKRLDAE